MVLEQIPLETGRFAAQEAESHAWQFPESQFQHVTASLWFCCVVGVALLSSVASVLNGYNFKYDWRAFHVAPHTKNLKVALCSTNCSTGPAGF